jgi:hypothetical protein
MVIDLNLSNSYHKLIPCWNYKSADWNKFVVVSEVLCRNINFQKKRVSEMAGPFNKAILRAALDAIPRGAKTNCKPYWTQELQDLEEQVSATRVNAEEK